MKWFVATLIILLLYFFIILRLLLPSSVIGNTGKYYTMAFLLWTIETCCFVAFGVFTYLNVSNWHDDDDIKRIVDENFPELDLKSAQPPDTARTYDEKVDNMLPYSELPLSVACKVLYGDN